MTLKRVRTRFAPSPTGPLHMGGVRTALYAYLFAKQNGGDFLLRIEDTDQNRYVEGAEKYIIDALEWSGIQIDEGVSKGGKHDPYRQSERKELGIYKKYAEELVEKGFAYYAFDTPLQIEEMRNRLIAAGNSAPQYGHDSRDSMDNSLNINREQLQERIRTESYVIRLKVNPGEEIKFHDIIRGEVNVNSSLIDDKVLLKSDGMPTYHLAHIVDDVLMEITHAIRGEEWLPSAPAHILVYRYLGWEDRIPQYAHLPLLLKPDGKGKLSKRDGDKLGFPVFPLNWKDHETGEITPGYRESGYYSEAFINMLALLGWNPGTEQEIFSMEDLIKSFSFEHVHKSGARFDPDKTRWFNEQYLRKQPDHELAARLKIDAIKKFDLQPNDHRLGEDYLVRVIGLVKDRIQFEKEITEIGKYLFIPPLTFEQTVIQKKWKAAYEIFFHGLNKYFGGMNNFSVMDIDSSIKNIAVEHNIKQGEIMQLLRVFISGQGNGVDLLGMMELIGKDEVIRRLTKALDELKKVV